MLSSFEGVRETEAVVKLRSGDLKGESKGRERLLTFVNDKDMVGAKSEILKTIEDKHLGTVVNASNYGLPLSAAPMRSNSALLRFRF